MTHPYFVAKARHVLIQAGADPRIAAGLAQWAEKAREAGNVSAGVVVTRFGDVVAETRYIPSLPEGGATYVTGVMSPDLEGVMDIEVGLAMARMRTDVIHVRYSQLCQGPPPFRVAD